MPVVVLLLALAYPTTRQPDKVNCMAADLDNFTSAKINEEETEKFVCPECGNESIIPTGGCGICLQCGYSKCN